MSVGSGEAGTMLFDTDVLIWVLRGNSKAAQAVDGCDQRSLSVVTYMELLQGARNKAEIKAIKAFLADIRFTALPLTENIGHRASIYMEEYVLADSLSMADALIAATAIEAKQSLISGNGKHYKAIQELELKRFRP
ncbi:MAG: type II toxin-antitoxin system VapC family toxin [Planctomycetaceae bacterium]